MSAEVTLTAEIGDFDVPSEVIGSLWAEAKDQVGRQVLPSLKANQVSVRELFQGKPVLR